MGRARLHDRTNRLTLADRGGRMKRWIIAALAVATVAEPQEPLIYEIRITRQRESADDDGIYGVITVQGEQLGSAIERRGTALAAGAYSGKLRYDSGRGFAVGPLPGDLATITTKGDFLIEV